MAASRRSISIDHEFAPAKVNLWLNVRGRRADGYHDLDSLVAFADFGDAVSLMPGKSLGLEVHGPFAADMGAPESNLVIKAAEALAQRLPALGVGQFSLTKNLPVASGLGGGSADAAAALRLLARANNLPSDHPALDEAAKAIGSDVLVCLRPRARMMQGRGEIVGSPLVLPRLYALLVNPGLALATGSVFAKLQLTPGASPLPKSGEKPMPCDEESQISLARIMAGKNDLEAPAIAQAPCIAEVLHALRETDHNLLARMSGSGATCFGLYADRALAKAAGRSITKKHPQWWVKDVALA